MYIDDKVDLLDLSAQLVFTVIASLDLAKPRQFPYFGKFPKIIFGLYYHISKKLF